MERDGVTLDGREASEDAGSFTGMVEETTISGSCVADAFILLPSCSLLSTSSCLVDREVFDLMLISPFDTVPISPKVLFLVSGFQVLNHNITRKGRDRQVPDMRYNYLNKMNIFSHQSDLIVLG